MPIDTKNTLRLKRIAMSRHTVDLRMNRYDSNRRSILFVHGIGASGRYFLPLAGKMSATHNVFVVDLPGYGNTPKPPAALSIRELSDVIIELTHRLNLEKTILIGHSMGCQIVARAVQKEPMLYDKMVLIGPTVNSKERTLFMQSLRLAQDVIYEPMRVRQMILSDYMHMGFRRYLQTCRHMMNDHIEESLADCRLPILIVRGKKDKIVPADWVRVLCTVAPDAKCHEIADAPHAAQYKMASRLAAVCCKFAG
ncbi:MAG TPA: alpha/beta fold hydrolase [Candidatus Saccharimonadales bacterium]|jgi:pimeloyl-ACP methyl ester carboxylesterase|nr:alpha/beta fold hydrolase [Candidatus Saccharimonadales bacterium]